jgi:hypothetical protein
MTSEAQEFEGRRSLAFNGEPLGGVLRTPCYKQAAPPDRQRGLSDQEDGVEMKLVPDKAQVQRRLKLETELLMRVVYLTYHPLIRPIPGVLPVRLTENPNSPWRRIVGRATVSVPVLNRGALAGSLERFATVLRPRRSVRVGW